MEFVYNISPAKNVGNRQDFLIKYCTNKRVLHFGCADSGLLNEKTILHQKLATVTDDLWGIDIDKDSVDHMRSMGFSQLIVADIIQSPESADLRGVKFDIVLLGEIIEHLSNPGVFLDNLCHLINWDNVELVVTVPNATSITNILYAIRRLERVHPDHNYWFSYCTLTTLLNKHGFNVENIFYYQFLKSSNYTKALFQQVLKIPHRFFLPLGDGIIAICKRNS